MVHGEWFKVHGSGFNVLRYCSGEQSSELRLKAQASKARSRINGSR